MLKRCSAIFAAIELWLPTSSLPIPRQLQAEGQAESEAEWVIEGNCTVDGVCVSSPNFPEPYGNKDYCLISLPKPALLEVTAFETEKGYDKLTVNGKQFSGTSLLGDSFNAWTNITWRSDESVVERGWQFCLVTLTCADGLPLIPVAVRDCPPGSAALPSCDEAAPGDLCEGDGKCGTRTDVNKCYDEFFTYPSSRDVYRKAVGSTGTTTATTTFPLLVGGSSDGWSVTGPCSISEDCIQSGNFPGKYGDSEQCGINMPQPSVINFTAFSTEKSYDILAVNGVGYSGDGEAGFIVVAWGNITWRADSSVASTGWELCFVSPKCHDGLALSPVGVPDCPPGPEALPSCDEALPGELCEGGCGTRSDINNCYDAHYSYPPSRDVYRKAEGNTLTTTMVTSTSTSTFLDTTTDLAATGSPWSVQGPCEAVGACVQSPNYPENYGDRQSCNLSLPKPSVVTILDFLTEPDMDFLTLHGVPFSGLGPGKKTFTLWTNISWRSDPSVAERGWKICLDPPPFCDDGLPLTPIAVRDCPPGSTVLPTCEEAAPGELCEADGQCGTRTDVNNCYDPSYTYPASRDVYRKFNGTATSTTTKTVSTVTTTTTSSSQSTTLLEGFWEGPAPWTASGGCKLHGACVESSNFPDTGESEDCEFSLPRPSVVRVTAFSAQDGDSLTINHEAYTGDDLEGQFFTIWSPISWHSNGEGSKFQLCYEPLPLCSDGLILSPVEIRDCPPVEEALPGATATMAMSMKSMNLTVGEKPEDSEVQVTGEYLTNYLKEMDGDDSQFKDINAAVVPLSTGSSPPRLQPAESILKAEELNDKTEEARPGSTSTPAKSRPKLDTTFCLTRCKPIWLPIKAHRFAAYRAKVLQLLPQRVLQQYIDFEKQGQYSACIKLLESATPGSLNVLSPASMVSGKPLLVETVLQLIVGYSGLCLKNQQGAIAVKLITQVLDNMSLSLRDLHPGHRTVFEAYLFDTALSVCYYMPNDVTLADRSQSFFQQASERYLRLGHINRYCKCCLRAAAVLHLQGSKSEAEYYTQQALNKLSDAPVSSLLAICYHNLAVHTVVQHRIADAVAHVRSYVALLRQLPKLGNSWMQLLDNTQWLILKAQELWPQHQQQHGIRDSQLVNMH